MTDWIEIDQTYRSNPRISVTDGPCQGEWLDEASQSVIEMGPSFSNVADCLVWARERCARIFIDLGEEIAWEGNGAAPLHPILYEPLPRLEDVNSRGQRIMAFTESDGELLKKMRTDRGLSVEELARLAHVDASWLDDVESGRLLPPGDIRYWFRIVEVLVRGIEFDPNEQRVNFGWTVLVDRFLAGLSDNVWSRHRMTGAFPTA